MLVITDGDGTVKHVLSKDENTESIKIPRIGDTVRNKYTDETYEVMRITEDSPRYRLDELNSRFGATATLQEMEDDFELIERGEENE